MGDYKPYNVINGKEIEIKDTNSDKIYAGDWAEQRIRNRDDMLVYGYYNDEIKGPAQIVHMKKKNLLDNITAVTGLNESGKVNLMKNISIQLCDGESSAIHILNNKGDMLLESQSKSSFENTIYIDPTSNDGIGFNILNCPVSPEHNQYKNGCSIVSEQILEMVKSRSSNWGPQIDNILRTFINNLIILEEPYNLIDLCKIITDKKERDIFIEKHKNELDQILIDRFENQELSNYDPIIRRLNGWVEDRITRQLMVNGKSDFSIYDAVENGKNIIFDFSGVKNESTCRVLTDIILSRLKLSSEMGCQNEEFFTIFDDFEYFNKFSRNIISDSKSNIGFILFTETLSEYDSKIRNRIIESNSIISFRNTIEDNVLTRISLAHNIDSNDIRELNKNEFFSKTMTTNGYISDKSVKASVFCEISPLRNVNIDKFIEKCEAEYAVDCDYDFAEYGASRFED